MNNQNYGFPDNLNQMGYQYYNMLNNNNYPSYSYQQMVNNIPSAVGYNPPLPAQPPPRQPLPPPPPLQPPPAHQQPTRTHWPPPPDRTQRSVQHGVPPPHPRYHLQQMAGPPNNVRQTQSNADVQLNRLQRRLAALRGRTIEILGGDHSNLPNNTPRTSSINVSHSQRPINNVVTGGHSSPANANPFAELLARQCQVFDGNNGDQQFGFREFALPPGAAARAYAFYGNNQNQLFQQNNLPVETSQTNQTVIQKEEKIILFKNGTTFLHFDLEATPYNVPDFKIDHKDIRRFRIKVDAMKAANDFTDKQLLHKLMSKFAESMDKWTPAPSRKALVHRAKDLVLIAHKFGKDAVVSSDSIFRKRWKDDVRNTWNDEVIPRRMTLLYFMYIIMAIETTNYNFRCDGGRPCCIQYEESLTKGHVFRSFVMEVPFQRKQELYYLRCRLDLFFSPEGLTKMDRKHFWWHEGQGMAESAFQGQSVEIDDRGNDDDDSDIDNLGPLSHKIDIILNADWVAEFPLNETDKRRFTDKYFVAKPSGKHARVSVFEKFVEFNMNSFKSGVENLFPAVERETVIELAKEALYIDKVFGKYKALVVADILARRMVDDGKRTLPERLTALLLIHVILSGESIQSPKSQPKIARSYCSGFSNDLFVNNFRDLVTWFQNENRKLKFYWMRLIWNSCLLDEYLIKIDECNFWHSRGVWPKPLPSKLQLKKKIAVDTLADDEEEIAIVAQIDTREVRDEIATVDLLSSDDEPECEEESSVPIPNKEDSKFGIITAQPTVPKAAIAPACDISYDEITLDDDVSDDDEHSVKESVTDDDATIVEESLSGEETEVEAGDSDTSYEVVTVEENVNDQATSGVVGISDEECEIESSRRNTELESITENPNIDNVLDCEETPDDENANAMEFSPELETPQNLRPVVELRPKPSQRATPDVSSSPQKDHHLETNERSRAHLLGIDPLQIASEMAIPEKTTLDEANPLGLLIFERYRSNLQKTAPLKTASREGSPRRIAHNTSPRKTPQTTLSPSFASQRSIPEISSSVPNKSYAEIINERIQSSLQRIDPVKIASQTENPNNVQGEKINPLGLLFQKYRANSQATESTTSRRISPHKVIQQRTPTLIILEGTPPRAESPESVFPSFESQRSTPELASSVPNKSYAEIINERIQSSLQRIDPVKIASQTENPSNVQGEKINPLGLIFQKYRASSQRTATENTTPRRISPQKVIQQRTPTLIILEGTPPRSESPESVLRYLQSPKKKKSRRRKKNYVTIFHKNRKNWCEISFSMTNRCTSNLRRKYLRKKLKLKRRKSYDLVDELAFAMDTFRKTVYDVLISIDEETFLETVKEAFFLEAEFGYGAVCDVAEFLVQQMQNGFESCKSKESNLSSKLTAFLIIHIMTAVESVAPLIIPNVNERAYASAFREQEAESSFRVVTDQIDNIQIRKKLQFLALTWSTPEVPTPTPIKKMYRKNCKIEASIIKDIIKYIKRNENGHSSGSESDESTDQSCATQCLKVSDLDSSDEESNQIPNKEKCKGSDDDQVQHNIDLHNKDLFRRNVTPSKKRKREFAIMSSSEDEGNLDTTILISKENREDLTEAQDSRQENPDPDGTSARTRTKERNLQQLAKRPKLDSVHVDVTPTLPPTPPSTASLTDRDCANEEPVSNIAESVSTLPECDNNVSHLIVPPPLEPIGNINNETSLDNITCRFFDIVQGEDGSLQLIHDL